MASLKSVTALLYDLFNLNCLDLPDESSIPGKRKGNLLFEIKKKKIKILKSFQKLLE